MVRSKRFTRQKVILLIGIFLLILIGIFRSQIHQFFSLLYGVTVDKTINLTRPQQTSFNILLMGIGGGTHEGPDLTDTIIFANVNVKQNEVHMFSVPRDLWIPDLSQKINSAYATGQDKNKTGIQVSQSVIEKVTGQKLDYVFVLDFAGFVKLVDTLGGIDVDVKNTLDDYNYPVDGKEADACGHNEEDIKKYVSTVSAEMQLWDYFSCRYKHLHVPAGMNHMDGQTALEFVRSRHGVGAEGSDFARSQRQQLVISAVRDKALSLGIILNPVKMLEMYNIIKDNIDTNIPNDKIDDFIKLAERMKNGKIKSYVLDMGDTAQKRYGLLINPPISEKYGNAWVLASRDGSDNFLEIHQYITCLINDKDCTVGENSIIEITPTPNIQETTKR